MITGTVNAQLYASVHLTVYGASGRKKRIQAFVDTGYDGFLVLPPTLIAELNLQW